MLPKSSTPLRPIGNPQQLRYVATEDIKPLVRARRETSEEKYIAFMRLSIRGQTSNLKKGNFHVTGYGSSLAVPAV